VQSSSALTPARVSREAFNFFLMRFVTFSALVRSQSLAFFVQVGRRLLLRPSRLLLWIRIPLRITVTLPTLRPQGSILVGIPWMPTQYQQCFARAEKNQFLTDP
jgi:hypothetical protein